MAGYIRQSTYNDGDVIQAADSNTEFDQLLASFSNTVGHKHDGTAAEGPVIGLIGDAGSVTPFNKLSVSTVDSRFSFYVDVSSVAVEQLRVEDGVAYPVTNNDIDLGTSVLMFKDGYFAGSLESVNLQVTNIKANDGTAVGSIADTTGVFTIASAVLTTADINGGTIDNVVIGGTTPLAGNFTTVDLTTLGVTNITANDGTAAVSIADTTGAVEVVTTLTATGGGSLTGTWADLGTVTTIDINSGTIDAAVIGGAVEAAGSFTALGASGVLTADLSTISSTGDLAVADGGTGSSTATGARTTLDVDQAGTALALSIALG
tara:strand:+ start:2779 stop:3735 length:957 start_codon:yes stop_codon:yes gene_type:complete